MDRPFQHQWEFGELFAPERLRKIWTVSELTSHIRRVLEAQIGQIWVSGEISNLRVQASGHIYFTLKDTGAQVACVLFRGETVTGRDLLADGQNVLVCGDLTVYEPRGQYQLVIRALEFQGAGMLQLAFERLKRKLAAEGLFAPERKRPIPPFPKRIGLVTSPTGAAIRDVLHVVARRNPLLEMILAPCRVQGEGAAGEIAAAIRQLNEFALAPIPSPAPAIGPLHDPPPRLDVILLTRGGGSLEDLWAFNEEVVARAIASSTIPVVSAVGHEIDFTISDFVADLRAATPSAAAEILTEAAYAGRQFLSGVPERLTSLAYQHLKGLEERLGQVIRRLHKVSPRRRIEQAWQLWDDCLARLQRAFRNGYQLRWQSWSHLTRRWRQARPTLRLETHRQKVASLQQRLRQAVHHGLWIRSQRMEILRTRLRLLGPEQVLARGYSLTFDAESGRLICNARELRPGQPLRTRLQNGSVLSRVESVENEDGASHPSVSTVKPLPGEPDRRTPTHAD